MEQVINEKYLPLFTKKPRYLILMGGRGAGRSTVVSQFANAKLAAKEYFRCAIMRYVLGDIRNSIYREILDRAEENGIKESINVNESVMTIQYGANSINAVGFKKSSGDRTSKLKSLANYNVVIIEEADEIDEPDFMQLDDTLRTLKGDILILLLLNPPPKDHWIIQRWFDLLPSEQNGFYTPKLKESQEDTLFIYTSWKDNAQNLPEQTKRIYESYRQSNPDYYWNMIRGLVPETFMGKIYDGWREVSEVPHEARLERYGIDFGYTIDPTAIVAIYYYNGGYIVDEIAYQLGMSNREIAETIKNQPKKALTIADSAEPKSIDEIRTHGVNIQPAVKGADSVSYGIQVVKDQNISYTKRSRNVKKGYAMYHWKQDKEGNSLNEPDHLGSDSMDAIRYPMTSLVSTIRHREIVDIPTFSTPTKSVNPAL